MLKPIVILLALSLTACATQLGVRDKTDLRRQMFSQIVFAPDFDSRRKDFLAKWASPLRITIKGEDGKFHKGAVSSRAETLAELTGLDITVVGDNKGANITVYFAREGDMAALAGSRIRNAQRMQANLLATGCHFTINKEANHRITGAALFIRTEQIIRTITIRSRTPAPTIKPCLGQTLTRVLGFANVSEVIQPSIFNADAQLRQPTSLDLKFIRALYAPTLKPGMPRREALLEVEKFLQ
ncbi:MAG: DUF2927 domain-containing protein [Alphaproteobacteria bacterium]